MDWILNIIGKTLGLDQGVAKLEMGKAYLGGIGMMLTGLASILTGLVGIFGEVMPLHDIAAYIGWLKSLGHDTNAAMIAAGAALISKGLADIGNRHAIAKMDTSMVKLTTDPGPIVITKPQGA